MEQLIPVGDSDVGTESKLNAIAAAQESPSQRIAFETYYKMGLDRSLRTLAHRLDKTTQTLHNWSKKYRWQARVKEVEGSVSHQEVEAYKEDKEKSRWDKVSRLTDRTIMEWFKRFESGQITFKRGAEDLERLVNLRLRLANVNAAADGSAVHIHQHNTTNINLAGMGKDDLRKYIKNVASSMEKLMSKDEIGDAEPIGFVESGDEGLVIDVDCTAEANKVSDENIDENIGEVEDEQRQ